MPYPWPCHLPNSSDPHGRLTALVTTAEQSHTDMPAPADPMAQLIASMAAMTVAMQMMSQGVAEQLQLKIFDESALLACRLVGIDSVYRQHFVHPRATLVENCLQVPPSGAPLG